jgi:preprotein translocase subunit Sec63
MRGTIWTILTIAFWLIVIQDCAAIPQHQAVDTFYYELLDVDAKATDIELKRAYRRQALLYHPDKHPNDNEIYKRFQAVRTNLIFRVVFACG